MAAFWRDVRFAWRLLAARPGWTLATLLCLGIATGANTAAFSVVNALLLRPLPFDNPDRLMMVALRERDRADTRPFSLAEYREFAARSDGAVSLIARTYFPLGLAAADGAQMVQTELVSGNYFEVLGITPVLGTFPRAAADRSGLPPELVISHGLWQRRFGGDPGIVGRIVRVNGHAVPVAAVAPPGFVGAMRLIAADLWLPASFYPVLARSADAGTSPAFGVMGRLADGVTADDAGARLEAAAAAIWHDWGKPNPPGSVVHQATGFGVPPLVRGMVARGSGLIFGLLGLLTAVADANVAALVLARAVGRHREIGVRLAMGAGRRAIARQMLTESLVLAVGGGAAGWVLAVWATRLIAAQTTTGFDYVSYAVNIRPDLRVLVYCGGVVLVTAVLFGLAPVWHAGRVDLIEVLKRSTGGTRRGGTSRTLRTLVVGQIAVSTTLLVGCGLLVRTYLNARAIDPGIVTRNIAAATIDAGQLGLSTDDTRRMFADLKTRISELPGVSRTSLTRRMPLLALGTDTNVQADPTGPSPAGQSTVAGSEVVTGDHFALLGIPLRQGRTFGATEPERPLVAVVNESMARRLWPGRSPIGRTFHLLDAPDDRIEVVGVAADVRDRAVTTPPQPAFYRPFSQRYSARMTLLVAIDGHRGGSLDAVRREIQSAHPDLAIESLRTLDAQRQSSERFRRQAAFGLGIVCALGLVLSSLGLFGVISYGVRERTREIGIRLALGAPSRSVRWTVMRQGFGLTGLGLALGAVLSLALGRVLQSLVFGVSVRDPSTMAAVSVVLAGTAFAAVYLPARWATRVNPAATLRSE